MILFSLISIGGILAGLLLLRRVPVLAAGSEADACGLPVSVIIPARNEENNLPLVLESIINSSTQPLQLLVVDDGSIDNTAAVAIRYGATVIASAPLPRGWTGKTWACHQGALAAKGDTLLFLDADTRFAKEGYTRIVECFAKFPENTALSILPFHQTQCWYEELSLFFNIVVAMSAGGFGGLGRSYLFGQSLLVRRTLYQQAGGHASVKGEILENLHLAEYVRTAGGKTCAFGGRGTLAMRMFPDGPGQLCESWRKAFAAGARLMSPVVLGLSIYWLGAAMLPVLMVLAARNGSRWPIAVALYLLYVFEIAWFGRQLGTFRWTTALLYPVALLFYFATFAQSLWRQKRGSPVIWRGRQV
jgi:4,4'-diaponeurosporenoate glycosyltransferase